MKGKPYEGRELTSKESLFDRVAGVSKIGNERLPGLEDGGVKKMLRRTRNGYKKDRNWGLGLVKVSPCVSPFRGGDGPRRIIKTNKIPGKKRIFDS